MQESETPPVAPADRKLLEAFDKGVKALEREHAQRALQVDRLAEKGETDDLEYADPEQMKEAWEHAQTYIVKLKEALREATRDGTRETQEHILQQCLDGAFAATLVSAQSMHSLEVMRRLYEHTSYELEKIYGAEETPWSDQFSSLLEYGEMQEDAYFDLCDMTKALQRAKGVPEDKIAYSPYTYACERYIAKHPGFDDNREFTDEEFEEVSTDAEDILDEILEPYKSALPFDQTPLMAWFVARALELHAAHEKLPAQRIVEAGPRSFTQKRQMPELRPANDGGEILPAQRLKRNRMFTHDVKGDACPPANDNYARDHIDMYNDPNLRSAACDTLSHIFLTNLDAGTDLYHTISAKFMLEEKIKTLQRSEQNAHSV